MVQFAPAAGAPLEDVDQYCYATPEGGVVDAETVAPDVRRYATQLTVTTPTVRAWPPGGVTLVNLSTFFAASAQGSGRATIGGQGYALQLAVSPQFYAWSFGDGSTLTTTDPGGAPPVGAVHHTYAAKGSARVTVTVAYGATYSVVTPFGTIGPEIVPGGAVRTLPATAALQVREAYAGLIG